MAAPRAAPRGRSVALNTHKRHIQKHPTKQASKHAQQPKQPRTPTHSKLLSYTLRIALKHPKQLIDFTTNKSSNRHRSEHLRQPLTAGPFPVCYSSGHRQANTSPTVGSVRPTGDQPSTPGKPTIKGKPAKPVVSEALR